MCKIKCLRARSDLKWKINLEDPPEKISVSPLYVMVIRSDFEGKVDDIFRLEIMFGLNILAAQGRVL